MAILRTSAEAFPSSRRVTGEIPYVLRVEFRGLSDDTSKIVGKPIACSKCNGFLISIDQIQEDKKIGKYFVCAFCGTLNVIQGDVVVASEETEFVLEPAPKTMPSETKPPVGAGSILAVIDVSGSMSGANLAAVKRSLMNTLDSLAANAPDTVFGMVEFESTVVIRDLSTGNGIEIPRESFASYDAIVKCTQSALDRVKMVRVGSNISAIKQHVKALTDKGGTALGPAMVTALTLAKHRNINRVILLTDGLANEGIGALEGYQVVPPGEFYLDIGKKFLEAGAIVDVVGIASGAGMELKTLGQMPETTGGQMYYVTPNELDRSISELAGATLLGRNVEVRLVVPKGVKIKDASGVSQLAVQQLVAEAAGNIGAVGDNHELYIEVEPEREIQQEEVPIQVQIAYTDEDGSRRVRAVTRKLRVARTEKELIETLDPTIGATFVTQKAGEVAFRGDIKGGRSRIAEFRAAMSSKVRSAPSKLQSQIAEVDRVLASEEKKMENREQMIAAAPKAASVAADQVSTENIRQARKSSKELFENEQV
ncbi:MAG: VWA domain-containing protein [Candidatus Thorarchaeota archaeon]